MTDDIESAEVFIHRCENMRTPQLVSAIRQRDRAVARKAWDEGYQANDEDSCEIDWIKRRNPYDGEPDGE